MVIAIGSVVVEDIASGFSQQMGKNEEEIDKFLRDVAAHIRDDAKSTAAFIDRTGNLRKSIGMRKSKFVRGGYIVKATGRNRGEGATSARGFHAWLVEFGHVKVLWGKRTSGRVAPKPYMRPAVEKGKVYAAQRISAMGK
jgi:hypothetical protein